MSILEKGIILWYGVSNSLEFRAQNQNNGCINDFYF